ncbi:MAG: hypothetical protein ACI81A_000346, partial [Paraglaciecola sp.]
FMLAFSQLDLNLFAFFTLQIEKPVAQQLAL